MSPSKQQNPKLEQDQAHDESQFRDVPTSDEHGAFISYFDTVLWVEEYLEATDNETVALAADKWDEPEELIVSLCGNGKLVAWGLKASGESIERRLSTVPYEEWPNLIVDMVDGQPTQDRERHGGRFYGRALTTEPMAEADEYLRPQLAWTALCFLKSDVLKHWPESRQVKARFSKRVAIEVLATLLKADSGLIRQKAKQALKAAGHEVSKRAFDDVWREARQQVGLPEQASAGRPRRSLDPKPE